LEYVFCATIFLRTLDLQYGAGDDARNKPLAHNSHNKIFVSCVFSVDLQTYSYILKLTTQIKIEQCLGNGLPTICNI